MRRASRRLLLIVTAAAVLLGASVPAWAQAAAGGADAVTRSGDASMRATEPGPPSLDALAKPLGLSTAQRTRLEPIFTAARSQIRTDLENARRKGQRLDEPEVTALLRTRDADLRERVAAVLTPQQLMTWDELMASSNPKRSVVVPRHGHHEMDTPQTAR